MSSRVLDIKEDGYIVYTFYEEDRTNSDTNKFFRDQRITRFPTILIFNDGRVIQRHRGTVEIEVLIEGMKNRDEQHTSPYDIH